MAKRSATKKISQLRLADFEFDQIWRRRDDGGYSPWRGKYPVDPYAGVYLLLARVSFKSRSKRWGFLTPEVIEAAGEPYTDFSVMRPHIMFESSPPLALWTERKRTRRQALDALARLEQSAETAFPVRFFSDKNYANGIVELQAEGFHYRGDENAYYVPR